MGLDTTGIMQDLIASAKAGNEVRAVTIALRMAAMLARERRQADAIAIRTEVDAHQMAESKRKERAAKVLDIAGQLMAGDYAAGNEQGMQGTAEANATHCLKMAATLYDEHQKWMEVK